MKRKGNQWTRHKKKRTLTAVQRAKQSLDRINEVKSSSSPARAVSLESEFVPIENDQNEGDPTFRIGERVAVAYLEVEGTTKVAAGDLKWFKATIQSGPTMVTKKGKHVCYTITYHGSAKEYTFFPITGPGKGGADRWQRTKVNISGKSRVGFPVVPRPALTIVTVPVLGVAGPAQHRLPPSSLLSWPI